MQPLIVASNSPRRHQIIREAGFRFDVQVLDVDESIGEGVPANEVAEFLARKKNKAYRAVLGDEIVLTADTVVIMNDHVLGKPATASEAQMMIRALSGQTHEVVSGVCISSVDKVISFSDTTQVTFEPIRREEIDYYINNYQPFDKAGSYGIQEWLGMIGIRSIQGSFYNVMGLPIHKVYQVLKNEFEISPV